MMVVAAACRPDLESQREVRCGRCEAVFHLCRYCDTGQSYCSDVCRTATRRAARRAANRRYQQSFRGRRAHAARQARYRRKVTHQAQPEVAPPGSVLAREVPSTTMTVEDERHAGGLPDAAVPEEPAARVDDAAAVVLRDVAAMLTAPPPIACAVCGRAGYVVRAEPLRRLRLRRGAGGPVDGGRGPGPPGRRRTPG